MVGPERPRIVIFGSSIVELSFRLGGWGATLADRYARKADISLRGYGGWNSRQALRVLHDVFPKDSPIKPSLAIVYFGGNDSTLPDPWGIGPHVPLPEYLRNMTHIANHIKSLSETTRIIFLSTPPVNEEQIREISPIFAEYRTLESCGKYSDALIELCQEINVKYVDMFNAIQRREDWLTTSFTDGIHFTEAASKVVAEEIEKVLEEADWEPSMHWDSLPTEFDNIHAFAFDDIHGNKVLLG